MHLTSAIPIPRYLSDVEAGGETNFPLGAGRRTPTPGFTMPNVVELSHTVLHFVSVRRQHLVHSNLDYADCTRGLSVRPEAHKVPPAVWHVTAAHA